MTILPVGLSIAGVFDLLYEDSSLGGALVTYLLNLNLFH